MRLHHSEAEMRKEQDMWSDRHWLGLARAHNQAKKEVEELKEELQAAKKSTTAAHEHAAAEQGQT